MIPLLSAWILLAAGPRSGDFVKGFREGNLWRVPLDVVLYLALLALVVVAVLYFLERWQRQTPRGPLHSDGRLFTELCHRHRLDRRSIRALRRLAQQADLAHLPEIFLRPEIFPEDHLPLRELRVKLFGK